MSTVLDIDAIRAEFPILSREVNGYPLVYLDNAASAQKPNAVIDAVANQSRTAYANVHRGIHTLSNEATEAYEAARESARAYLNAPGHENIIFTKGSTEGINLVASALAGEIKPGDEIVLSVMEHHSNIIPWHFLRERHGAVLRWIGLTEDGRLDMDQLSVIDHTTAAVSIVHQSNILGTINPVRSIMDRAREVGALGIVDACQSIPHMRVNVEDLGADLLTWSGHKMLGPTGIGLLWGRSDVLNSLPPFLAGGSMIESVTMEGSTFAPAPQRFEAGVPMVAQAVGLEAAVRYLDGVGIEAIEQHEHELTAHALATLTQMPGVRVIGPESTVDRGSAISFVVDGLHPHDVGQVLDDRGVAVRVGHHCAWPTCRRYGVPATTRLSTYLYNDLDDIDAAAAGVRAAQEFFGVV